MISYSTRIGTVNLSEEYLSKLIGKAVTSCFGVAGMAPADTKQRIFGTLSKKEHLDKGIRVIGNADKASIELHIIVTYGMNIQEIAKSIIHKVKYVVKNSTGIDIESVSVKVDGIKEN